MQGIDKTQLEQIEVGDYVAHWSATMQKYRICAVTAITKTQIAIKDQRFDRSFGGERTSSTRKDFIYPLGAMERRPFGEPRGTYAQVVEIEKAEHEEQNKRYEFAKYIANQTARSLVQRFDSAILEQIARQLGYKDGE